MGHLKLGMPTLIELADLEANVALARRLGMAFVELNMNAPEYSPQPLPAERLERKRYGHGSAARGFGMLSENSARLPTVTLARASSPAATSSTNWAAAEGRQAGRGPSAAGRGIVWTCTTRRRESRNARSSGTWHPRIEYSRGRASG